MRVFLLIFIVACCYSDLLKAEENVIRHVIQITEHSSYCDIFAGLSDSLPAECGDMPVAAHTKTDEAETTRTVKPKAFVLQQEIRPVEKSIAMKINFAYDSSALDGRSKRILDNIAAVLSHPDMYEESFVIEGHTDSKGSRRYNQRLSVVRATVVQNYLIQRHYIQVHRLISIGKGELELLDKRNPTSAINRRVEFVRRF